MATKKKNAAPWDRPPPKRVKRRATKHLSDAQKQRAARRAKRAGRPYPNLVDNMHEAEAGARTRRSSAKKKASTKRARKATPQKEGGAPKGRHDERARH